MPQQLTTNISHFPPPHTHPHSMALNGSTLSNSTPIKVKQTSRPSHTSSALVIRRDNVLKDFEIIPVYPFDQLVDSVQGSVSQDDIACARDALVLAKVLTLAPSTPAPNIHIWS